MNGVSQKRYQKTINVLPRTMAVKENKNKNYESCVHCRNFCITSTLPYNVLACTRLITYYNVMILCRRTIRTVIARFVMNSPAKTYYYVVLYIDTTTFTTASSRRVEKTVYKKKNKKGLNIPMYIRIRTRDKNVSSQYIIIIKCIL